MLENKKLMIAALVFILGLVQVFTWSELSFAQTSGGMAKEYDDSYGVKHRIISRPYLDVEVWVDKGEGAIYHPGDEIEVYFRASCDCYVVLYNIDTRGYVYLLYPVDEGDDPYVEGGRVYKIPDRFDDYDLTINGPEGVEYIQAVASMRPLDLPNFPGEYTYEGEVYAYNLDGEDPFEFMEEVNAEIARGDYASDVCIFNVEYPHPKWYYWPQVVYVDRPVDIYWGGAYIDYPWGVEVWIDGVFYGITPITIPALVVGRHYFSFWFQGCWIWRDWFRVRRDHVIHVWGDCHDRYRYVKERYVEKSYRAEKAKRRRGINQSAGLVKPVQPVTKGALAKAEASRITQDKKLRREESTKRRGLSDGTNPSRLTSETKVNKREKIGRAESIRRFSPSPKVTSIDRKKVQTKKIRSGSQITKTKKTDNKIIRAKRTSKTTQKIHQDKSSRSKISASRISNNERKTTKSNSSKKASIKKTGDSRPAKRRR